MHNVLTIFKAPKIDTIVHVAWKYSNLGGPVMPNYGVGKKFTFGRIPEVGEKKKA